MSGLLIASWTIGPRAFLGRLNGGPSTAAPRRTPLTLITGVDHARFVESSARRAREGVRAALASGGDTRFILAPGCSLPTYAYPPLVRAAREESAKSR